MATAVQIPLAEYLQTVYRPDQEYIDGELKERNVGKFDHARVQALLALWFGMNEAKWSAMVVTEQRVQVSATRVRIPDVALILPGEQPDVLTDPPLLVVEILSPADKYSDVQERAREYQQMGVQTIWIIDPKTRSARQCNGDVWAGAEHLTVPGTEIYLDLGPLFAKLTRSA